MLCSEPARMSPLRNKTASWEPRIVGIVAVFVAAAALSSRPGRVMRMFWNCARLEASAAAKPRVENNLRALFIEFGDPVVIAGIVGCLFDAIRIELQKTDRARIESDRTKIRAHPSHLASAPFVEQEGNCF